MMMISEVKKWAKTKGYEIIKEKDDSINGASYYWAKQDDILATGVALSVTKVATAIFNHMTNNEYIEHQQKFLENKDYGKFTLSDY
jgi:hypothetical protein